MRKLTLILLLVFALVPAMAQNHDCGHCPNHGQHGQHQSCSQATKSCNKDGIALEIVNAFPKAKSIKKEASRTNVYDAQKNLLGYVIYSKPASNGIKGYNGETPLMIAFGTNDKIISVTLLNNNETPSYLRKVFDAGLLKSWNGMKAKKAVKKKVDTVTGATLSSRSIIKTLQAALK